MQIPQRKSLMESSFVDHFDTDPILFVQAPGRVDLMGSHTDYNLGYVLTQAIDRNTWIAARPRPDGMVRVTSLNVKGASEFDLASIEYDTINTWTNYIRGVADVFQKEGYKLNG